uniref:restriction endonuclease subunit S n=1 Tax=uncultured Selenomonas sp. TaxID=159275 RepID=UPI0025F4342B
MKRIQDIATFMTDGDWIESDNQSKSGIRLIQTGNIGTGKYLNKEARAKFISEETFENLKCTEIFPGDILVSRLPDPVGRACILPEGLGRTITAVDCTILRLNEDLCNRRYLVYYTQSPYYAVQVQGFLAGSTRISQMHVIETFSSMDAAIENRQRVLTLLDELVKSRFVEMFGDPVKNPYRWPKKLLTDLGDCKNGMNFHRDDEGYEIHCLGVGDFQNLSVISDAEKLPLISLDTVPSQEYLLQDEDVVFVRSNGNKKLVGRCVAVYPKDVPTTFSGFCIRFRKNNKIEIQTKYLLQVLKSDGVKMQMEGRGANIQNLNQKILSQVEIPIPPLSLQTQFSTFVHQVEATKTSVRTQLTALTTLRAKMMQE